MLNPAFYSMEHRDGIAGICGGVVHHLKLRLWRQKRILMNAKNIFLHSTNLKFVLEIKA